MSGSVGAQPAHHHAVAGNILLWICRHAGVIGIGLAPRADSFIQGEESFIVVGLALALQWECCKHISRDAVKMSAAMLYQNISRDALEGRCKHSQACLGWSL